MTQLVAVRRGASAACSACSCRTQFTPESRRASASRHARAHWFRRSSKAARRGQGRHQGRRRDHVDQRPRRFANAAELRNSIGVLRIGEKVEIGLLREGKPRRVTAVIGERYRRDAEAPAQIHPAFEGATLTNADNSAGVLVQSRSPRQPGRAERLRTNDVILAIGRDRITNLEQLRAAVQERELRSRSRSSAVARRLVFPVG